VKFPSGEEVADAQRERESERWSEEPLDTKVSVTSFWGVNGLRKE